MSQAHVSAWLGMLCWLFLGMELPAEERPAQKSPLHVSELNERPIIGELGIPLGTCTEIQAKIIAGRELRMKQHASDYLLSVTHVDGKPLEKPAVFRFRKAPGAQVDLARDGFELHQLKTGEKTGKLTDIKIRELEEGYVGKIIKLTVYEVGGFSGIPRNAPGDIVGWQDSEFHFSTSLVVLQERQ